MIALIGTPDYLDLKTLSFVRLSLFQQRSLVIFGLHVSFSALSWLLL